MLKFSKVLISFLLSIVLISSYIPTQTATAAITNPFSFVILSNYKSTMDIGDELYILAITSTGKKATWKSSNSKVASVNTYGMVTAKKAGTALITAKIKDAEASCAITVNKTSVYISKYAVSTERGRTYRLSATTSNGSPVTWKSSKKSIATVNEYGTVTSLKPGETEITATADGTVVSCKFTVLSPKVILSKSSISLYRGQSFKLTSDVSSGIPPVWKTNKKSVATVNKTGTITAIKHGTAIITATVDGVSSECLITVLQPTITLSKSELSLKKGNSTVISATVSSGNTPSWSTSNANIVTVNSNGEIKAIKKGKAYIYASEDGIKSRCTVTVTD